MAKRYSFTNQINSSPQFLNPKGVSSTSSLNGSVHNKSTSQQQQQQEMMKNGQTQRYDGRVNTMSSNNSVNNSRAMTQNQTNPQQLGLLSHHSSDNEEDEKECFSSTCGPKSPLNWIYERNHDRSFFSRNTTTSGSINKELSKEEIRKKAAQNILRGDSDDDMPMMTSTHVETGFISTGSTQGSGKGSNGMNGMSAAVLTQKSNQLVKKDSIATSLEINTQLPYIQISTAPEQTGLRPLHGEARIVAPNVSKLSPFSAVEVRLETGNECVAVLCSVDVLKMRSGYFHDILSEQEKNISPANALQGSVLWRDPIIIAEQSPFEAAAFLESLHEGRVLFRGEWNYCWARLSVAWIIEDLIHEYAAQIDDHMNKLLSLIQTYHWRLNPSVLNGMRIGIFRKSSNITPTVVTGMVLESHNSNIGYSKVRVAFDGDQKQPIVKSSVMLTNLSSTTYTNNHYGPPSVTMRASSHDHNHFSRYSSTDMDPPPLSSSNTRFPSHSGQAATNNAMGSPAGSVNNEIPTQNSSVVGDVSEPFWIQQMKEGSMWNDPDELFLTEAKRFFTITDKRIFWEMGHALIELPEISNACKGMICNANDLVTILKKPEWKVIWTNEAADILPREMAAALVQAAYVYNPTERN